MQLPLPDHINQFNVINTIEPQKDIDGLTYYNAGLLLNRKPSFIPCHSTRSNGITQILQC